MQVVRDERLSEGVEVLVCGRVSGFVDDIEAACGGCGCRVWHRPHAPRARRVLCLACALGGATADDSFVTGVRAAQEIAELLAVIAATAGEPRQ